MPVDARERWSDYQIARGSSAQRAWDVTGVPSFVDSSQALAALPVQVGSAHPEDSRLTIPTGGISAAHPSNAPTVWRCTARYSNESGNPNPGDPDPLNEPPVIDPQQQDTTEPIDQDRYANYITNSVRVPFSTPVTRYFGSMLIVIARNESTFNAQRALAFRNKLNSRPVSLTRLGSFGAEQLLCRSVRVQSGFATNATHVRVIYTLEARDYYRNLDGSLVVTAPDRGPVSGFAKRVLDQGRTAFYVATGSPGTRKIGRIIDSNGNPVSRDVPLSGSGFPASSDYRVEGAGTIQPVDMPQTVRVQTASSPTGPMCWLYYDVYFTEDFTGLALPGNGQTFPPQS